MVKNAWRLAPSTLQGRLTIPPSKSQSIRALLFALLAKGTSSIRNLLQSPDLEAMLTACRHLGAKVEQQGKRVEIEGLNGNLQGAEDVIQVGNSGLILRLVGAVAALSSYPIVLTGDYSVRHLRPVDPLVEGLSQLGAKAQSARGRGAPLIVQGPLLGGTAILDGQDSQPVSGLLIASAFAQGPSEIFVLNPGEKPWVALTLSWFDRLGIPYAAKDFAYYKMEGKAELQPFRYTVPADFSSLAYPLAAALVTKSEITIENLDFSDPQGDKLVLHYLQQMGASLEIDEKAGSVRVKKTESLQGATLNVNGCIDATPLLAVIGCFAEGKTEIQGAAIARKKESDRLFSITQELKKMGAKIEESADGLTIYPSSLKGAEVHACNDHRIALSLAVAAFAAKGETLIRHVRCADKSYPRFCSQMQSLGGQLWD